MGRRRKMKKTRKEKQPFVLHAAQKRFERAIRVTVPDPASQSQARRRRKNRAEKYGNIEAPSKLDMYSPKNHTNFVGFLEALRKSVKSNQKTFISFRSTNRITAAAGLMLVAEVSRLVKAFPESTIRCSLPEKTQEGIYKNDFNLVESALNKIGFFKLIGQENNKKSNAASVRNWRQLSGDTADGSLADSLLNTLSDMIPEAARKKIYRGAIEAIANCVEHAYPSPREDGLNICDNRWWMLVGNDERDLSVIVCDLGVGIPKTMPTKHSPGLLSAVKSAFGILNNSDSEMIRASTHIRETRTKLTHRGKGGKDFRSITTNFPSASLTIRSNKGAFFITGEKCKPLKSSSSRRYVSDTKKTESTIEHQKSICGTLMEWTVPLQDLKK